MLGALHSVGHGECMVINIHHRGSSMHCQSIFSSFISPEKQCPFEFLYILAFSGMPYIWACVVYRFFSTRPPLFMAIITHSFSASGRSTLCLFTPKGNFHYFQSLVIKNTAAVNSQCNYLREPKF